MPDADSEQRPSLKKYLFQCISSTPYRRQATASLAIIEFNFKQPADCQVYCYLSISNFSWRKMSDSLLFRILYYSNPNYLVSRFKNLSSHYSFCTRSHNSLLIISHFCLFYLLHESHNPWNSLPQDIRGCCTFDSFKTLLLNYLLSGNLL